MSYAKKICFAVSALLIVMIGCIWKSVGIVDANGNINAIDKAEFIEFDLKKRDKVLTLSGVFGKKKDIEKFVSSLDLQESVKNDTINYDKRRIRNEVTETMKDLIPVFMSVFKDGKIGYHDGQLAVNGTVDSDEKRRSVENILKLSGVPYYIQIEVKGKSRKRDYIMDMASYTPQEKDVARDIGNILKFDTIEFQTGSAKLTNKGLDIVDKIASVLRKYENVRIRIAGHTDNIGDPSSNLKLSKARVRSVKARLVSRGINADRLKTVGFGETRPIFPNTTEENRKRNRRVEFIIITSKGE